jgi:hypothetical protein
VTGFHAIRTSALNFNFVFSDYDAIKTHWSYIYSRLPYLLLYTRRISEHAFSRYGVSDPVYLDDIERRVLALTALWRKDIPDSYASAQIDRLAGHARETLAGLCRTRGWREPTPTDLQRMAENGAWPGEPWLRAHARSIRYRVLVKASELLGGR